MKKHVILVVILAARKPETPLIDKQIQRFWLPNESLPVKIQLGNTERLGSLPDSDEVAVEIENISDYLQMEREHKQREHIPWNQCIWWD